jgi:6-phosphogluconolactonase (cycloisomerase 2 family)
VPQIGYVYVASADIPGVVATGGVYQFAIGGNGSITPLATASVPTGVTPTAIVADPSGQHVYVASVGDTTVSQYAVTSGGALQPLSPPSLRIDPCGPPLLCPASLGPVERYFATVDPAGHFLYVVSSPPKAVDATAQFEAYIAQYAIGSDGTLSRVTTSYVGYPSSPLTIDPSGHHAYMASGTVVLPFSIQADGTLSAMTPVSVTPTAVGVALSPNGQLAYVLSSCIDLSCNGQVGLYTVDSSGGLRATGVAMNLVGHGPPMELLIDPSGQFGYLLTEAGGDAITASLFGYAIEPNGVLSTDPLIPDATPGHGVAASLHHGDVYVLASDSPPALSGGEVTSYSAGLTALGSTSVAGLPQAMAVVD